MNGLEGTIGRHPSGRSRVRLTARDWGLFTGSMDCRNVASALNIAAQVALRQSTRDLARAAFRDAAQEWAVYGGADTEAREAFELVLGELHPGP